jgi:hypothetical protein
MEGGHDAPHGVIAHDAAQPKRRRHVSKGAVGRGHTQRIDRAQARCVGQRLLHLVVEVVGRWWGFLGGRQLGLRAGLAIKKPTQKILTQKNPPKKTHPKKPTQKNPPKNPLKMGISERNNIDTQSRADAYTCIRRKSDHII